MFRDQLLLWGCTLFCAAVLTNVIVQDWRRRKRMLYDERFRRGHCLSCGYDLRGARARCPECGRAIDPREA